MDATIRDGMEWEYAGERLCVYLMTRCKPHGLGAELHWVWPNWVSLTVTFFGMWLYVTFDYMKEEESE